MSNALEWRELSRSCRTYLWIVYLVALPCAYVCFSAENWYSPAWLLLTLVSLLIAPLHLRLPKSVSVVISMNDVFTLLALIHFGPGPALITYWLDITFTTLTDYSQRFGIEFLREVRVHRFLFNMASCAVSAFSMFVVLQGVRALALPGPAELTLSVAAIAAIWLLMNKSLLAAAVSLWSDKTFTGAWRQDLGLDVVSFLGSAGFAGLFTTFYNEVGIYVFIMTIPVGFLIYKLYRANVDQFEHDQQHIQKLNELYEQAVETQQALRKALSEREHLEERLRESQKMEAIGRLAGGIAHDFNNLLVVILGYGDVLLSNAANDSSSRHMIQEIRTAAGRAADLVQQLLAFSRKQLLSPVVLDLNSVVTGMSSMLRRLIGAHIELRTDLDPSLGHIKADPTQIEQVILNLALNARDAMASGGRLTIATSNRGPEIKNEPISGPCVVLEVRDTGHGMDEEQKSHAFEPFFTTKPPGKGTGLGLATVYGVVEQSGGHVTIDSRVGIGTRVRVYFPLINEPASPVGTKAVVPPSTSSGETLLLVEDEPAVLELTGSILEHHGYRVLRARDGHEALRISKSHTGRIDLLVTDVVMPQMSGKDLAETMERVRPETKVLFLSGYPDDIIGEQGRLELGTAFLQKPFHAQALAQKVREVLDSERTPPHLARR